MRVLLVNPEFPRSFWTLRETLKQTSRKTLLPPLGLLTVTALLPPSRELRLVDLNTRALTASDWLWADLVMITGMIIQRQGIVYYLVACAMGEDLFALREDILKMGPGGLLPEGKRHALGPLA